MMKVFNSTPGQREKNLPLISSRLDRHHETLFAYSHGSFMEGGPFHDIDIAIFLEPDFLSEINFRYEMQLEAKLEKAIEIPAAVDIRILNTAKLSFQFHALRGRLLLDRKPEVRIDFTRQIASRYLDIAPVLKHHTKEAFGFDPGPRHPFVFLILENEFFGRGYSGLDGRINPFLLPIVPVLP